jgi:hypothetical protein
MPMLRKNMEIPENANICGIKLKYIFLNLIGFNVAEIVTSKAEINNPVLANQALSTMVPSTTFSAFRGER